MHSLLSSREVLAVCLILPFRPWPFEPAAARGSAWRPARWLTIHDCQPMSACATLCRIRMLIGTNTWSACRAMPIGVGWCQPFSLGKSWARLTVSSVCQCWPLRRRPVAASSDWLCRYTSASGSRSHCQHDAASPRAAGRRPDAIGKGKSPVGCRSAGVAAKTRLRLGCQASTIASGRWPASCIAARRCRLMPISVESYPAMAVSTATSQARCTSLQHKHEHEPPGQRGRE
jgi:hypothetical protein